MTPPPDLWDRLGKLHKCCDVNVSSAMRDDGTGTLYTSWTVTISRRDNRLVIQVDAATMLEALVEGLAEAEGRLWIK